MCIFLERKCNYFLNVNLFFITETICLFDLKTEKGYIPLTIIVSIFGFIKCLFYVLPSNIFVNDPYDIKLQKIEDWNKIQTSIIVSLSNTEIFHLKKNMRTFWKICVNNFIRWHYIVVCVIWFKHDEQIRRFPQKISQ